MWKVAVGICVCEFKDPITGSGCSTGVPSDDRVDHRDRRGGCEGYGVKLTSTLGEMDLGIVTAGESIVNIRSLEMPGIIA